MHKVHLITIKMCMLSYLPQTFTSKLILLPMEQEMANMAQGNVHITNMAPH